MEEIKLGEYVINQNRLVIGKIIEINEEKQEVIIKINNLEIPIGFWNIKKHNKNIIDLIECGDYVNGYRIDNIINGVLVNRAVGIDRSGVLTPIVQYEQDIKTILTKERFEQNLYKV